MLTLLLGVTIASWFALIYPIAQRKLATAIPPLEVAPRLPAVLLAAHAFMPLVFVVHRESGVAVLEEGLTASNVVTIMLTGLIAVYLAMKVAADKRVLLLPFAQPYLPFTLMIGVNLLSTLWSIVPSYTFYRALELAILYLTTILLFDRRDIEHRLGGILTFFVVAWLVLVSPEIFANLSRGIVFSSAKNNMMPLVCVALALHASFSKLHPGKRLLQMLLALLGFVVAGSAASTAALVALLPAIMISSGDRSVRLLGGALMIICVGVFLTLMIGLDQFPALLELLSVVLQKPIEELAGGTGRLDFWPAFVEATGGRLLGAGFSAGDRFIQLLLPEDYVRELTGMENVFIATSHNMFMSAWAGTGMVGLALAAIVLVTALTWAMKLDITGRRIVIPLILILMLNGMTTPGILHDWNVNILTFVAMLAYARNGTRESVAELVRGIHRLRVT